MLDNGVTHHLIANVDHFKDVVPYMGHDTIIVSNGGKITIENVAHLDLIIHN